MNNAGPDETTRACSGTDQSPDFVAASDAIAHKYCRFEEMFAAREIVPMVELLYASSAVLEGRDLPKRSGVAAISRIFADARKVCASIVIELDALEVANGTAYCSITNRNHVRDGDVDIHRGLMIWRLIDGEWMVVRDVFFADGNPLRSALDMDDLIDGWHGPRRGGQL